MSEQHTKFRHCPNCLAWMNKELGELEQQLAAKTVPTEMPTRDPHEGDVVYLKFRNTRSPLVVDLLGRITKIEGVGFRGCGTVQWYNGTISEHPLRDLVSVTKKLAIALHDVERFSKLIAALGDHHVS